ncbi:MAG: HlyD family efflux transporter periplasmic adaptor subunit [Betaproteobacteria bacterium]|nr:HlyD family efflux transporter periplasmic adaptor subunit [Betaproteobacteria bacterium]
MKYRCVFFLLALAGCGANNDGVLPGYVEADFVRVAAPYAGRLVELAVVKGAEVEPGAKLFALDRDNEIAARDEAAAKLAQSEAQARDLATGKRKDEIAAVAAQVEAARAVLKLAESDLTRQQSLAAAKFISPAGLDAQIEKVRSGKAQLAEAEAQLRVAHLAARNDQRAAAAAASQAAQAALAQSAWMLAQKEVAAPVAARVDDTLYRVGEWVPAGSPVVSLLPPGHIKLRFYVPQARLPEVRQGDIVKVSCDGCGAPRDARVAFIAAQAEFTPPVIYSQENRAKLVFLVEAYPLDAQGLRPGQPVDVRIGTAQ